MAALIDDGFALYASLTTVTPSAELNTCMRIAEMPAVCRLDAIASAGMPKRSATAHAPSAL